MFALRYRKNLTWIRGCKCDFFVDFSSKTYVVGTWKNRLNMMFLLSTHNICLFWISILRSFFTYQNIAFLVIEKSSSEAMAYCTACEVRGKDECQSRSVLLPCLLDHLSSKWVNLSLLWYLSGFFHILIFATGYFYQNINRWMMYSLDNSLKW